MSENYHLTFNREKEGWDIKKEGASRPSDHFESHSKALKRARELALNSNVNLIIHDESGAITGSESAEDIGKGVFSKAGDAIINAKDKVAEKVEGAVGAVTSTFKS